MRVAAHLNRYTPVEGEKGLNSRALSSEDLMLSKRSLTCLPHSQASHHPQDFDRGGTQPRPHYRHGHRSDDNHDHRPILRQHRQLLPMPTMRDEGRLQVRL